MRRLPLIIFAIFFLGLASFFVYTTFIADNNQEIEKAQVIIPSINKTEDSEETENSIYDDISQISFIPLQSDETLLNTHTSDLNGDNYDDQINAVRNTQTNSIFLIIGIYNTSLGQYQRKDEIDTGIVQVNSFNFHTLDITGNHKIELVFSGFNENNENILKVFALQDQTGAYALSCIAEFQITGTVYIQQLQRTENYAMGLEKGDSFPIWLYTVDETKPNSLDQLQFMYNWNEQAGCYTKVTETRISGKKIAAKELAKIQDGKVSTFVNFLDGLWYKVSNNNDIEQLIFFNSSDKEIIFCTGTTQEVYSWVNSTLRRNGIYLSTVNTLIRNLSRRFDITLSAVDEIRVRLSDDLRMVITEETTWDGKYKKMQNNDALPENLTKKTVLNLLQNQKTLWVHQNQDEYLFNQGEYAISGSLSDEGSFSVSIIQDKEIVQLRSRTGNSTVSGFYIVQLKKEKKEKENISILELQPVKVSLQSIYYKNEPTLRLEEKQISEN